MSLARTMISSAVMAVGFAVLFPDLWVWQRVLGSVLVWTGVFVAASR